MISVYEEEKRKELWLKELKEVKKITSRSGYSPFEYYDSLLDYSRIITKEEKNKILEKMIDIDREEMLATIYAIQKLERSKVLDDKISQKAFKKLLEESRNGKGLFTYFDIRKENLSENEISMIAEKLIETDECGRQITKFLLSFSELAAKDKEKKDLFRFWTNKMQYFIFERDNRGEYSYLLIKNIEDINIEQAVINISQKDNNGKYHYMSAFCEKIDEDLLFFLYESLKEKARHDLFAELNLESFEWKFSEKINTKNNPNIDL